MSYFIKQIGNNDCGITSLKILLAKIYHRKDFLYYPEVDPNLPLSLKEIMKISKNEGVNLSSYRIIEKTDILKLKHKKIMILLNIDNSYHLVNVIKISKRKIKIYDTERGIIKYKLKDLFDIWHGEVMEVTSVTGSNFKLKNKNIVKNYKKIILNFMQILTYVLFLSGLYFINKELNFMIPLCLFISFGISFVLYQYLLLSFMKQTDKKIFYSMCRDDDINIKDKYCNVIKLRNLLFSNNMTIINSVLLIIFSMTILGINSYLSLLCIFIVLLCQIILKGVGLLAKNKSKSELELLEKELFKSNKNKDIKYLYDNINDKSYKIVQFESISWCILCIIDIIVCLFLSSFEETISLNFVLFHFFAILYIANNFDKVLKIKENNEDLKYYKSLYYFYSNNY